MQFMEKYNKLCILLLILLSYSIHCLQPFDVSLFSSLLHYYSAAANILMFNSIGFTNLFKRAFWSLFLSVWKKAFIFANITFRFTKIRIFPYNPCIVFDVIIKSISAAVFSILIISKISVLTHHM